MEKRALIAVILSLAVLIIYQSLFSKPQSTQTRNQNKSQQIVPHEPGKAVENQSQIKEHQKEHPVDLSRTSQGETTSGALASFPTTMTKEIIKDVNLTTELCKAIFTTEGGKIKSWQLQKYMDNTQKYPMEMLQNGASLDFAPYEYLDAYKNLIYKVDKEKLELYGQQKNTITFTADVQDNLRIEKKYTFHGDRYDMDFQFDVTNISKKSYRTRFGLNWEERYTKERLNQGYAFVGPAVYINGKRNEIKPKNIKEQKEFSGNIGWVAFEDKYFVNGIIPINENPQYVRINRIDDQSFSAAMVYPDITMTPGQRISYSGHVYLGPKLDKKLALVPNDFNKALHYGWFDILARPLLIVLKWFEKYTHNWGIAIILLTILIKIAFYPLTHKSYKSMKEMQKIQPKMATLREKFKNDKEKLNREMWHLYKTHKVSPLGGCLPMILQIPVFFALYQALLYSIELRHSPFIPTVPLLGYKWIIDLSAKDPLYITPLIMGASMFLQQKMTPTTGDPMQAKIMLLMPVIFTVMFLNFPSGLVIYWLVNNVLSIGQQHYINKYTS